MPITETVKYNVSQQELYMVSRQGWKNCMAHLTEFAAFNPRYTAHYCEICETEIDIAQAFDSLPDTAANNRNKIVANNSVFNKLNKMLNIGQIIFAGNEAIRQKFVFGNLKNMVCGINPAGICGYIADAVTAMPIANAIIATANNTYAAMSDADGHFDLKGMAASDYQLKAVANGYIPQTIPILVKTGVTSALTITLNAVAITA